MQDSGIYNPDLPPARSDRFQRVNKMGQISLTAEIIEKIFYIPLKVKV
jgi:hypothetical protein